MPKIQRSLIDSLKHNLLLLGLPALVIFMDQWTKLLVKQNLAWNEAIEPIPALAPFFRIVNWQNTGAAFGLFHNGNVVLAVLAILISIVIIYYYQRVSSKEILIRIALSLQLGGALGNLVDRFTQGYVTDFLSFGSFPVFNVADACVTVGVGLLLLAMLLQERRQEKDLLAAGTSMGEPNSTSSDET